MMFFAAWACCSFGKTQKFQSLTIVRMLSLSSTAKVSFSACGRCGIASGSGIKVCKPSDVSVSPSFFPEARISLPARNSHRSTARSEGSSS
jgi:hypothetical protein